MNEIEADKQRMRFSKGGGNKRKNTISEYSKSVVDG